MLIDGHLRAETTPDFEIPVLILDLDEAEADKLLLTLDPLALLAESDSERIGALLRTVKTDSPAVEELLRRTWRAHVALESGSIRKLKAAGADRTRQASFKRNGAPAPDTTLANQRPSPAVVAIRPMRRTSAA